MPSHYQTIIETIRFHRTTADRMQDELNAEIELLIEEGLVARPQDEQPLRAVNKYIATKIFNGAMVSAADIKSKVACTRDLTHRGITAMLTTNPLLVATESKDQFGLKQFRRIDQTVAITPDAVAAPAAAPAVED